MLITIDRRARKWHWLNVDSRHEFAWERVSPGDVLVELVPEPASGIHPFEVEAQIEGRCIGVLSQSVAAELQGLVEAASHSGDRVFLQAQIVDPTRRLAVYSFD